MESTEKCEAIIQHFNGKYIKTPPGVAGNTFVWRPEWFHFFTGDYVDWMIMTDRLWKPKPEMMNVVFSAYRTLAV